MAKTIGNNRELNNSSEISNNYNTRYDCRILAEGESLSNNSRETGISNNTLIVGTTGCGKTGSVLYPTLKELHNESVIISDSKGQLHKMFKSELEEKGYKVGCISLINWEKSDGYNPLMYIRRNSDGGVRYQDVITLSNAIISKLDSDEPIWEESARQLLQFLIGYTLEALPQEDWNMQTVCKLYHALTKKDGFDIFEPWCMAHKDSFPAIKLGAIKANALADKMLSSIFGFVNVALTSYEMPESKYIFQSDNTVDLRELGRTRYALFIEVSDTDHTFDTVQSIIFSQCMSVLFQEADNNPDGRLKVPVSLIMDDFAASINIPDFDRLISVTRSRDISISIILQSLAQLDAIYGEYRATSILDNCDTILYMGAQNIKTAEIIGLRIKRSQEDILSMPRDKAILIITGQKPRIVNKTKPYQYQCE